MNLIDFVRLLQVSERGLVFSRLLEVKRLVRIDRDFMKLLWNGRISCI